MRVWTGFNWLNIRAFLNTLMNLQFGKVMPLLPQLSNDCRSKDKTVQWR